MLAAQLLAGGDQSASFSLEAIAERYVGVELDKEVRRQDWSGKLSGGQLEYAARDGVLYYAGFSTGFRSGGVNLRRLPDGEFDRYDPEDLLAFEAGMKSQWPSWG
jgi:outer membrane receptor protein involved in Fe transport